MQARVAREESGPGGMSQLQPKPSKMTAAAEWRDPKPGEPYPYDQEQLSLHIFIFRATQAVIHFG